MIIGVPKEIKDHETRVGLVPSGVTALREAGHEVLVETHAGEGSSLADYEYAEAGASILDSAAEVWQRADLIVKVKEPQKSEYGFFRPNLILFTYLHLAPLPELTDKLVAAKVTGVAYETIRERDGSLPLLTPMSEVAGRMSIQVGEYALQKERGGRGVLLGGVPGVEAGKVAILGGGVVGTHAAKMAIGTGADVSILDISVDRLRYLDDIFQGRIKTIMSNRYNIEKCIAEADLVVGGVLVAAGGDARDELVVQAAVEGLVHLPMRGRVGLLGVGVGGGAKEIDGAPIDGEAGVTDIDRVRAGSKIDDAGPGPVHREIVIPGDGSGEAEGGT